MPQESIPESYWWGLNNSNGLNDLLLVHLRSRPIKISNNCSHAGLVAHSCGEVDWFLRVIFGKTVITQLFPMRATIRLSNLLTLPRCLAALFRGRKAREPIDCQSKSRIFDFVLVADHVGALRIFGETCIQRVNHHPRNPPCAYSHGCVAFLSWIYLGGRDDKFV
jgi:hypothetical protein